MRSLLPSQKPLSLAIQKAFIRERFPQFNCSSTINSCTWIGLLQPTLKSAKYLIKVIYKLYYSPQVFVIKPSLNPDVPHTYKKTGALCLYFPGDPGNSSWNKSKLIGATIIPWTAEWLYFYELWLATGHWFGKEAPHGNPSLEKT